MFFFETIGNYSLRICDWCTFLYYWDATVARLIMCWPGSKFTVASICKAFDWKCVQLLYYLYH